MNKNEIEMNKIKTQLEMLDEMYEVLKDKLYGHLAKDNIEDLLHDAKNLLHLTNLIRELKEKYDDLECRGSTLFEQLNKFVDKIEKEAEEKKE